MFPVLSPGLWLLASGLLGLLAGSFLNVCIHRWPRDLSVVRPRSRCPSCEAPIAWYDNLPLLSYALLGGRCRACGERISWRYPVVEALTALAFLFFALRHGQTLAAVKFWTFAAILIGLIFADLEERILPDELTLGGAMAGLAFAWLAPVEDLLGGILLSLAGFEPAPRPSSVVESALGAALPPLFLWISGALYQRLRRREGLGLGDVKMMSTIGAFLGLRHALSALILASLAGSVIGLAYIRITGKDWKSYPLPLGSFLGLAALAVAAS